MQVQVRGWVHVRVNVQVPWCDVPGSKVRLDTPARMAVDVARVRLLYSTGVWRVPRKRADAPQGMLKRWRVPEYIEQHDVATIEQIQRTLDGS